MDNQKECNRRKNSLQEDRPSNRLENVPHDIMIDILSRLPITSLIQFKCVCRAFHTLVQDPRLPNLHLARATGNNPCLILHSGYPIRNLLYFVDEDARHGYNTAVKKIDSPLFSAMPEYNVVGSCNGTLCLYNSLYCHQVHIYNPFTGTYIELPPAIQYTHVHLVWGFGFHPRTKEYKVVRLVYHRLAYNHRIRRRGIELEVQILTLGSDEWRSLGNTHYRPKRRNGSDVLVNGALHWVSWDLRIRPSNSRLIVAFDIAEEKFQEVPIPDCSNLRKHNYDLVVLRRCLSAVVYCSDGQIEIWVMKEYNVKESWTKEFNLGKYVPIGLNGVVKRPLRIWRSAWYQRLPRVLCLLKNGEILLQYRSEALVSYDPENNVFRDLIISGLPNWFHTVIHVGSLI